MRRKMIPGGTRGVGGRLCPWSRCLTWAKPVKIPPCQGSSPGCKPGQRGQMGGGGQETEGQGRSTGATCPLKQTTSYIFSLRTSFVCLSFLSPLVSSSTPQQSISKCFYPLPPTVAFSLFLCVHKHTIYSSPTYPLTHSIYLSLAVSHSHHKPLPSPPAPIFSGR